jgi:hypothetical protein
MANLTEYQTLLADVNRMRETGPPEGTSFRDAVAPLLARIKEIESGLTKDQINDARAKAIAGQSKAKGGKVRGYRYGTPKGGVRKMASCRGRKAQGNKD